MQGVYPNTECGFSANKGENTTVAENKALYTEGEIREFSGCWRFKHWLKEYEGMVAWVGCVPSDGVD